MKYKQLLPFTFLLTTFIILLNLARSNSTISKSTESSESSSNQLHKEVSSLSDGSASNTLSPEEKVLMQMSLEEKVGQLFLVRYPEEDAEKLVDDYKLGGYIWFAHDFENKTPGQVQAETTSLQENSAINLLMAVDEEGGTVTRISLYPQFRARPFESPYDAYINGSWEKVQSSEEEKAILLKDLGFNLNLAPVADVTVSPEDFIYDRSFSTDPDLVAQFIELSLAVSSEADIGAVLKHFPGYGANSDTHVGIAYDDRTLEELEGRDFIPFKVGIEAGVDAILVAHNVMTQIDSELPATLSPAVIRLLRENLAYDGVIMTDDLIMEGLTQFATATEAAVLAVEAGNDLLISSEITIQWSAVLEAVKSGRISEERLDASVLRILRMKFKLGIIEQTS